MNDVVSRGGGRHRTTTTVSGATTMESLADEGGIDNHDDDGWRCSDNSSPADEGVVDDDNDDDSWRCDDDGSLEEDDDKLPADEGDVDDDDDDNRATSSNHMMTRMTIGRPAANIISFTL